MPFTYPFCYVPAPEVVEASKQLITRINSDSFLSSVFAEGKMLGVLITEGETLFAFSGLAGGKAVLDGFVPPIFDLTDPQGYFRKKEAEISAMAPGPARALESSRLQDWLFCQYKVSNALGESLNVKEIFALRSLVPPGGTGDCAAPKLLQEAYRRGLKPLAMGEFWYGRSPEREVRESGRFYPSCAGKCGPLLSWMMNGLNVAPNPLDAGFYEGKDPEVLFVDDSIIVVDKPAGMLSVPGRVSAPSLLGWLRERYGDTVESCHRLDMDTSGLIVFARNVGMKARMEAQFSGREVYKTYRARLVSGNKPFRHSLKGTIALPLMLDYYDRPRQMVAPDEGKPAVTEYEVLSIFPDGEIDVRFHPITGRSHQLRVHAAHERGLGHPIKGDRLYGDSTGGRLFLHAETIEFNHPLSGERMKFTSNI